MLFNWSRTNPPAPLIRCGARRPGDELQQLLREYPERKLRLIGSGLLFEPIHSVPAEGSQALLVDLHHLRGQLDKTADTVTYLAGTPLDTVYADLIAMDRMPPASPGVIGIQTLGGAPAPAPMAGIAPVRPVRCGGCPDRDAGERRHHPCGSQLIRAGAFVMGMGMPASCWM